jgi:prevent-host-death family protein
MPTWKVQEAKARFSELLEKANAEGPQVIARHGKDRAVVLSVQEYRKLKAKQPDFRDWILAMPKVDLKIRRSKERPRRIVL